MIITSLETITSQALISPGIQKALDFLRQTIGKDLPNGRIEIDGANVYALVQSYTTKPENASPRFEAHRKYIDFQYVVSGKELLGWAPLDKMAATDVYDPAKDVQHGTVSVDEAAFVPLTSGGMVVVYPWDAHAPGLAAGQPAPVKKIVIKVAV